MANGDATQQHMNVLKRRPDGTPYPRWERIGSRWVSWFEDGIRARWPPDLITRGHPVKIRSHRADMDATLFLAYVWVTAWPRTYQLPSTEWRRIFREAIDELWDMPRDEIEARLTMRALGGTSLTS